MNPESTDPGRRQAGGLDPTGPTTPGVLDERQAPTRQLGQRFRAAERGDNLARAKIRSNLRAKLFGAPAAPVKIGRFVILDRLGEGGMGIVYQAYDPDLDRRVALKILQTGLGGADTHGQERLRREAQALAQLSHPNVVAMHDVGVVDGQVFMVMEFVVGQTLRQWVEDEERTWRAILDVYLQAGRGLRAAHERGLVHRDFKPDNVQVGEDGRIRVLDFGLARGEAPADAGGNGAGPERIGPTAPLDPRPDPGAFIETARPRPRNPRPVASEDERSEPRSSDEDDGSTDRDAPTDSDSHRRLLQPLTATGAILGTPAYMSPEQHVGQRVGPASDQFSFCVSLYEGLYGQRPFAGSNIPELRKNVQAGNVRAIPAKSRAPGWLAPVLVRGMSSDPADRYPSMAELLAALGRDSARRRQTWLVAALVLALVGVSIYALTRSAQRGAAPCRDADTHVADLWSADRRSQLESAFASAGSYGQRVWPRVAAGLATYRDDWVAMHERACLAHRRGEQSGAMLDTRMACLDGRKQALASALGVLGDIDAQSLANSVEVVHKLPSIDDCGRAAWLEAAVPPPADPDIARRVEELRKQLSMARALEDAGRLVDAQTLARTLADEAATLGYDPLTAEVLLVTGRVSMTLDRKGAVAPLRRAAALGLSAGVTDIGVEALARTIFVEGTTGSPELALAPAYLAEALVKTLDRPTFAHGLLLNNVGVVHMSRGDKERARSYLERALKVKDGADESFLELAFIAVNLALVTPDAERRTELLQQAVTELSAELGPAHPKTIELQLMQVYSTTDPRRARETLSSVCELYRQYHPTLTVQRFGCLYYLGFLEAEFGEAAAAVEHLRAAAALPGNPVEPWLRDLASGQAMLASGDHDDAEAALARAAAALADQKVWWQRKRLADALLAQGMLADARGRPTDAIAPLSRALEMFQEASGFNDNVDTPQRLNRTRLALASALWPTAGQPDAKQPDKQQRTRALELIAPARAWYQNAGPGYERQRAEIGQWLRARNSPAPAPSAGP